MRVFTTGATRDTNTDKLDYEGFLSPIVLERFARYMHQHRVQADGQLRDSDNWQKGMPRREYATSLLRHFMDVWLIMRGYGHKARTQDIEEALCALVFNGMGLLHEVLLGRDVGQTTLSDPHFTSEAAFYRALRGGESKP